VLAHAPSSRGRFDPFARGVSRSDGGDGSCRSPPLLRGEGLATAQPTHDGGLRPAMRWAALSLAAPIQWPGRDDQFRAGHTHRRRNQGAVSKPASRIRKGRFPLSGGRSIGLIGRVQPARPGAALLHHAGYSIWRWAWQVAVGGPRLALAVEVIVILCDFAIRPSLDGVGKWLATGATALYEVSLGQPGWSHR
jgi:hypothetical protein